MPSKTLDQQGRNTDPKEAGPKPPYSEKLQEMPGSDQEMQPKADHGEETYRGRDRLRDRVALITGGDSGIGRAVAIAYAREGAHVAISYLPEEEQDAQESAKWVRQADRKVLTLPGDIQDERHCEQMVNRVFDEFGKLDILVNNAAYQMSHEEITEWSSEEWDKTFRTNIYAMFYLCKAALPRMQAGGVIINTASVQAYKPNPKLLAYAATKGAIVTYTKALAELAIQQGVRANAVAPGPVWTPLIPASFDEQKVKEFGKTNPMGRAAQPVEMAPAFVFLASEESRFVNGSVMDMTGGLMLP
jgi:NAD(P)-dependent dehydrogenase (short-subunit alcohol dehydrogenase family)